jgi:hypothetical protein
MDIAEATTPTPTEKKRPSKLPVELRDAIRRDRWIEYPAASIILAHLQSMFDHPIAFRPPCAMIVGETNTGKTSIAREFQRRHTPTPSVGDTDTKHPVVFVETPPGPFLGEFYGGLLRAVNAPAHQTSSRQRREMHVLDLFPQIGVKMIIIDEIHNILPGNRDQRTIFLNGLKFLTNTLQIPITVVGTRQAESAFQTDQQFGNRFEPFRVPNWKPDMLYGKFIQQYVATSGFEMDISFKSTRVTEAIQAKTKGRTGDTLKLLRLVMYASLRKDMKCLHASTLDEMKFTSVDERRAKARET